jgi:hypothetical protein
MFRIARRLASITSITHVKLIATHARFITTHSRPAVSIPANIDVKKPFVFVDTNILIHRANSNKYLDTLSKLQNYNVLYTETVKAEFLPPTGYVLPPNYVYFYSGLSVSDKVAAYDRLMKLPACSKLTPLQQRLFQDDLFIVFEASYLRYSYKTGWNLKNHPAPNLLTNNLILYHTLLTDPDISKEIETVVNLSGFEHLVDSISIVDFTKN